MTRANVPVSSMSELCERVGNIIFTGPYSVKRGKCSHAERYVDMIRLINLKIINPVEVEKLKEKIYEASMNYSGAVTRNFFKVSEVIELTSIFFCGPSMLSNKECIYTIEVTIWEGLAQTEEVVKVIDKTAYCIGNFGEQLWIDLGSVYIKPYKWYTIEFTLNGDATLRLDHPLTEVDVKIEGRQKKVNFQFLYGSRQMPEMEFWLVPPSDMRKAHAQWKEVEERPNRRESITNWDILFEKFSSCFI